MLLAYRGAQIGAEEYVNRTVIPLLCRKAGVPAEDVRGSITGHRTRATIASQLYNATEPMSLSEIPLTAVRLIDLLADVATPAGPKPRELDQATGQPERPSETASTGESGEA